MTDTEILDRMIEDFPGLITDQSPVNGGDVVEKLSMHLCHHRTGKSGWTNANEINPLDVLKPTALETMEAREALADAARSRAVWEAITARLTAQRDQLLAACRDMLECFTEAHEDEVATNHHGDGPDCSYCESMESARLAIARAERGHA